MVVKRFSLFPFGQHFVIFLVDEFAQGGGRICGSDVLEVVWRESSGIGRQIVDLVLDVFEVAESVVHEGVPRAAAVGVLEVFPVVFVILGEMIEVVVQEVRRSH